MKNLQVKKLAAAVVAAFGVGAAGTVAAAVTLGTPVKFASEMTVPANLTNDTNLLDVNIPGLATVNVLTAPVTYRVDLTGGVKFAAVPTLVCSASITTAHTDDFSGGGTAAGLITGTLAAGGNGQNYALFTMTTGQAAARFAVIAGTAATAVDTLYLSGSLNTANCALAAGNYTADDQVSKSVSAVVTYTIGGQTYTDSTTRAGTFISFTKALSASFATTTTGVVIDGVTNSTKFTAGSNMTTLTAMLGTVSYVTAGSTAIYNSAGTVATAGTILSSAAITISGATLAAATTGKVWISTAANTPCGASVGTVATSVGSSVTITAIPGGNFVAAGMPMEVCITVPGTVTIQESTLGGSIAAVGATGFTPNVSATANTLDTVTTNGQTRNAYLVHAAASSAKVSSVRVINKSGLTGTLRGTFYNEAGTDIGGGQKDLGSFTADQHMLTLTSSDIETKFGTTLAATAKGHIKFYFSKGNYEVLNFTQNKTDNAITLSNTSTTDTK